MESLEPTTVEELVRRHTPDLVPHTGPGISFLVIMSYIVTWTLAVTMFAAAGVSNPWSITLASVAGLPAAVGAGWIARRQVRRFAKQLKESPWLFYDAVAARFAGEVERQRARAIGPESEWGRARLSLEGAAQEADRSVAYWTQRLAKEPGSDIATTQLAAARRLRDKFHSALSGLDERARVLVTFFNDCEARVAVLQSTKRDYEEIRKLEGLADRSDDVVSHAEATLASIGASFVSEALRVANALGGLERIGLAHLAGEVPLDQIESLADRIVESTERDRTALERVADSI